jgi:NADH dehydrogenase
MRGMKKIIVVGGGFAGATLVRHLACAHATGIDVTLISEDSYMTFNPMLAEVVGAAVFPEHVVAPLREFTRHARFVMGRVNAVDFSARTLCTTSLQGPREFQYDHLVFAFGNRARLDLIAGMAEHGHVLKTIGDAIHLRNLVLRRLAQMELEADPEERRALGHFVVIGGGFSGVEVAGALADVLRGIRHYYPRVSADELAVSLLHDGPILLPQLPDALGHAATESLMARGVSVRLQTSASRIEARLVRLQTGESVPTATAIATVGTRANALTQALTGLTLERGRIVCRGDCSVAGLEAVWAIGDCAQIPLPNGGDAIATAQFAVAEAKHLTRNLKAVLRGAPTQPFDYRSRGMMATVGHHRGVAELLGLKLTGLPAWMLWRAYYLSQMPTLGRKFRVFVEWTWGMFFRPDITHFRFDRSAEQDKNPEVGPT